NIASAGGMEGECELFIASAVDSIKGTDAQRMKLNHRSELSGGGIAEVVADASDPYLQVYATAKRGKEERVFAASRSLPEWQGGSIAWVRGSLPYKAAGITNLPVRQ